MKKIIFILLILASCEKNIPDGPIQRICWECKYCYSGQIPQQIRNYCDGTDIGLQNGNITETQIRQFETTHYIQGILTIECKSYNEK